MAVIGSRRVAGTLLVVYALCVAFIVFSPNADVPTNSVYRIWSMLQRLGAPTWLSPGGVEFLTNVAMFVPLSLLGATLKPQWRWASWLAVGLACTLVIEVVQKLFLPGRSGGLVDMIANALGTLLGYWLVALTRRFS